MSVCLSLCIHVVNRSVTKVIRSIFSLHSGIQVDLNNAHASKVSIQHNQSIPPRHHSTPLSSPQRPQVIESTAPDDYGVEFSLLVSKISEIIEKNSTAVNLASIKHALALVTIHKMSTTPLFSDKELEKIKQSKNIFELTEHCRKHWSWSNYSLLKLIVKKSGLEEAKGELRQFQKVVNVRQKVKNLGDKRKWLQNSEDYAEGYENMMVVLDEYYDDITVHQLEEVENFIAKTTNFQSSFAIKNVEVSRTNSVLIKWRIPTEVVPFVVMLAFQNKAEFLRRSFLLLRIAGMDVFNLCRSPKYVPQSPQVCTLCSDHVHEHQ